MLRVAVSQCLFQKIPIQYSPRIVHIPYWCPLFPNHFLTWKSLCAHISVDIQVIPSFKRKITGSPTGWLRLRAIPCICAFSRFCSKVSHFLPTFFSVCGYRFFTFFILDQTIHGNMEKITRWCHILPSLQAEEKFDALPYIHSCHTRPSFDTLVPARGDIDTFILCVINFVRPLGLTSFDFCAVCVICLYYIKRGLFPIIVVIAVSSSTA